MATVFATFSALKDHVKLKIDRETPAIDNLIFKLHYRATFLALLVCCLLVTSRQYIGEHIRCISDTSVPNHVIETYCFFTSTYTVVRHMNVTLVEEGEVPHPGVGPLNKRDIKVSHTYYQWVPFVLFFQSLLFYLPHYIWRHIEGGRLKSLISGLHLSFLSLAEDKITTDNGTVVPSKLDREEKIRNIRLAFLDRLHLNKHWAFYLGLCEISNFLNIILQIYVTNLFLGGAFLDLGWDFMNENRSLDEIDPLDKIFPKVTKCTFHKYGASGTIQKHDALCVMALNIVNEKIYVFLWFWFIFLAVVTAVGLVWRMLTMVLHSRSESFNKLVFSMACSERNSPWKVLGITRSPYYFGDWLFLYYIAKNVDNHVFRDLLQQLAEDLEEKMQHRYQNVPTIEEESLKKD